MRADLPLAVAALTERCTRPSLVFDLARIAHNMRAVAAAAREADVVALFALKSFPHPAVRALAAEHLDGFDAASVGELVELPRARVLAITDPSGRAIDFAPPFGGAARSGKPDLAGDGWRGRLIVGCETVEQVRAAPARAEIAIRLSASLVDRDPAIGAILEGSGRRRSRFGLDVDPAHRRATLVAMVAAAAGRPIGLHVHHGAVSATSGERFVATARAALAAAAEADFAPRFLDLGGAWHAVTDLAAALRELRAAVPDLELVIEPGRAIAEGAGFACGAVTVARELADRTLRVVDLSRTCHLRWSPIELVAPPPAGGGRAMLFAGPTCYEDDVLGEWIVAEPYPIGARVIVRGVTGYAVGWNTGFGGIAPADVIVG